MPSRKEEGCCPGGMVYMTVKMFSGSSHSQGVGRSSYSTCRRGREQMPTPDVLAWLGTFALIMDGSLKKVKHTRNWQR